MSNLIDIQDKEEIRQKCIDHRQRLLKKDINRFSHMVATRVLGSDIWHRAKSIGLYSSINGEVSTDVLLRQAWQEGKEVFLPRCIIGEENPSLEFAYCRSWSDLVLGPFGVLEPEQRKFLDNKKEFFPDIVIVPVVALTKNGYRLGYGKGFYDRLFAQPEWKDVIRIALAYSFQFVDFVPDSVDVPVKAYVTESEFVWVS